MAKDRKLLLKEYELYIKSIEENSSRRGRALELSITINTALLAFDGIILQLARDQMQTILLSGISILGIVTSEIFRRLLKSYAQLSKAKFEVLNSIEKHLPAQPYTDEWNILDKGKNSKKYTPLSKIEQCVLVIFIIFHIILITSIVFSYLQTARLS